MSPSRGLVIAPKNPPAYVIWHWVIRAAPFALCLVVLPALCGFSFSDYFALRIVEVRAADVSLAREVAAQLRMAHVCNTLWAPLRDLVAQALRCPRVKSVRVKRRWPDTIILELRARRPLFTIGRGERFSAVDEEGVVLYRTGVESVPGPVVIALEHNKVAAGGRLNPDCLQMVRDCMEGARRAGLPCNFVLNLTTPFDYRMRTPSGTLIKLGGGDNLVRKVIIGATIERFLLKRQIKPEYVDVRVPERNPCWKEASATPPA